MTVDQTGIAAPAAGARDVVLRIHEDWAARTGVSLPLRLWDGTETGELAAPFRVVLHHEWSLRSMLLPPTDLAAGEAYVHGDLDVEGDLVAALHAVKRIVQEPLGWPSRLARGRALLKLPAPPGHDRTRRVRLRGRKHSVERDRVAVQFHYDLGNDFFRLFLDTDLVYSCAYFAQAGEHLDRAQARKLDLVCRKLRLQPGERLLDVGCGWGSLLIHAARTYGIEGVGVTLSQQQHALATERVANAGLADRVDIRLQDYREVEGRFDAVASVGMFEHVGPDLLGTYFARMYELTAPGGRFLNHGITTGLRDQVREMSGRSATFIGKYVFPDGGLVPAWHAARHLEQAGFELVDVEQLRPHYALTLRNWVERLEANHDRAVQVSSERDYRIWHAYMAGSVVGFETGDLGVVQVLGSKGASLPLGRAWMLPDGAPA